MNYESTIILLAYCALSVWFSLYVIMSLNTIHDNAVRRAIQFLIHTLILLSFISVIISVGYEVTGEDTFGYTIPDLLMYFTIAGFLLSIGNRNGTRRTVVEEAISIKEFILTVIKIYFGITLYVWPFHIAINGPVGNIFISILILNLVATLILLKFGLQVHHLLNGKARRVDKFSAPQKQEKSDWKFWTLLIGSLIVFVLFMTSQTGRFVAQLEEQPEPQWILVIDTIFGIVSVSILIILFSYCRDLFRERKEWKQRMSMLKSEELLPQWKIDQIETNFESYSYNAIFLPRVSLSLQNVSREYQKYLVEMINRAITFVVPTTDGEFELFDINTNYVELSSNGFYDEIAEEIKNLGKESSFHLAMLGHVIKDINDEIEEIVKDNDSKFETEFERRMDIIIKPLFEQIPKFFNKKQIDELLMFVRSYLRLKTERDLMRPQIDALESFKKVKNMAETEYKQELDELAKDKAYKNYLMKLVPKLLTVAKAKGWDGSLTNHLGAYIDFLIDDNGKPYPLTAEDKKMLVVFASDTLKQQKQERPDSQLPLLKMGTKITDVYDIDIAERGNSCIPIEDFSLFREVAREGDSILLMDKDKHQFMIVEEASWDCDENKDGAIKEGKPTSYSITLIGRAAGPYDPHITMVDDLCMFEDSFSFLDELKILLNKCVRIMWEDWDEYRKNNPITTNHDAPKPGTIAGPTFTDKDLEI